jgi:tetratricopeptide (TPR) repeat protein
MSRFADVAALSEEAEVAARAAGDEVVLARLSLIAAEAAIQADPNAMMREQLALAEQAADDLERLGDEYGAVWAARLIGCFQAWQGNSREAHETWSKAAARAEHLSPRLRDDIRGWLLWEAWWGPHSTDEGIARCTDYLEEARKSGLKHFEAIALAVRGVLTSYRGRFEEGRADLRAGRSLLRDLGNSAYWTGTAMLAGDLELTAGDPRAAYDTLTEGHEVLAAYTETGYLATIVGHRSQAALALGRDDEALELAAEAQRLAQKDDFEPISRVRLIKSQIMARRGDFERADELLGEAAELIEHTDFGTLHIDLYEARANVYRLAGRTHAEREALERALAAAEQKGHLVAAERARARLAEL